MSKELSVIDSIIDNTAEQFVSTLAQYKWHLLPDAQLQAAKQALTRSDYIEKIACQDKDAVHAALINAAILGLDLTEGKRQGWLLPRKNQQGKTVIVLQVGYKGVEAIHQRMGVIDRLSIRVTREKDEFTWSGDDQEKPIHKADWMASNEDRGNPTGAFAITYYPDGTYGVTVTPIETIYSKHRDRSDAWKGYQKKLKEGKYAFPPPWVSDEKSMIEKTMAYIASKQWPANIRDNEVASKILETLHEVDTTDYSLQYTAEQRDRFKELLDAEDSLGMFLFENYVGIEVFSALWKIVIDAVPRGGKGKKREELGKWTQYGWELFHNVKDSIANDDLGLLHESMEGITDTTKHLLMKKLDKEDSEILVRMMQ